MRGKHIDFDTWTICFPWQSSLTHIISPSARQGMDILLPTSVIYSLNLSVEVSTVRTVSKKMENNNNENWKNVLNTIYPQKCVTDFEFEWWICDAISDNTKTVSNGTAAPSLGLHYNNLSLTIVNECRWVNNQTFTLALNNIIRKLVTEQKTIEI